MILCLLILTTVVFVSPPGVVNYFPRNIYHLLVVTIPGLWFSVLSGTHETHNVITLGLGLIKLFKNRIVSLWASSHYQPRPLAWLNTPILWSYILVYSPLSGVSPGSVSPVVASVMVPEGYCSHSLHLSLLLKFTTVWGLHMALVLSRSAVRPGLFTIFVSDFPWVCM